MYYMAYKTGKPANTGEEILHLKGKEAKKFLDHLSRKRTPEELKLYKEADRLYAKHCKI